MISFRKLPALVTMFAALMLGTAASHAGLGGIRDGGAFFSEQAKGEASRIIGDVERGLKKDIVIETFQEVPDSAKGSADLSDKAAASRFFSQWAQKQAKQQGVSGVYVLIVRRPAHLQIEVGDDTLRRLFTASDKESLIGTMRTKLHAKQDDAALLEGVRFISSTMRAHAGANGHPTAVAGGEIRRAARESSGGWLVPIIVGLLAVWVVSGIIRALLNRGSAGGMGMPQGSGGGGFLSSLVGGMFGAAAGMWMYDQFFGSHGNAAERFDGSGTDTGQSTQDTEYSGSGADFGDDSGGSGGGDSGDFGGGDFGGGDSGGGGDF